MIMTNEDGHISIEDATVDLLYDNINMVYSLAAKGKIIYKDLSSHDVSSKDIILTIRSSSGLKEASKNLQDKFGIKKQTSEYILSLPLTQLSNLNCTVIQEKLQYYILAESSLKKLKDHRNIQ